MKYIIQSCIKGDTKWNYRSEVKGKKTNVDTLKDFYHTIANVIKQDNKLNIQNTYRVLPQ